MSPNVVVVDENPAVVSVMTQVLERAGHEVVGCLELSAAEAVIAQRLPDAVLLELRRRNEYAGWSLLCRLRQRHDTGLIPVLVTSGDAALLGRYERELVEYGVSVLRKPFTDEALIAHLSRLIHRRATELEHADADPVAMPAAYSSEAMTSP